jgi:hypothetical protein
MDQGTVIGLVLAVTGIGITILIAFYTRRLKRIDRETIADNAILPKEGPGNLSVLCDGKKLDRPRLVIIRIANSGRMEVRPGDFDSDSPLTLSTSSQTMVATASVLRTKPNDLSVALQKEPHWVAVRPLLLNRGESVDIQLVLDGKDAIDVTGRIAGGSIRDRAASRRRVRDWLGARGPSIYLLGSTVILMLAFAVGEYFFVYKLDPRVHVPSLIGHDIGSVLPNLRSVGLHLGSENAVPAEAPAGTIVDQSPGPGTPVSSGSSVTIVVSTGLHPR